MTVTERIGELLTAPFLRLEVELEPYGSPTFQPTTFANTGPSFYTDREGRLAVVVESVASMANQLEQTIWDSAQGRPADPVASLPWLEVRTPADEQYTTSRTAAHRLYAASLVGGKVDGGETFEEELKSDLGDDPRPPIAPRLAEVAWRHDPLTLIHGVWLAGLWSGRARISRSLSARIDAHGVQSQAVQVGGQKTADSIAEVPIGQSSSGDEDAVFGEVPAFNSEVSAETILARILLDVRLLRSYRLGVPAERALVAVAVLELRELLDAWPRRRSRCALRVVSPDRVVAEPKGWEVPEAGDLREACVDLCREATGSERAEPRVVCFDPAKLKSRAKKKQDEGSR